MLSQRWLNVEIAYSRKAADVRSLGIIRTRLQFFLKDKKSNSWKKIFEWENQRGQRSNVVIMVLLALTSNSALQGTLLCFTFFYESEENILHCPQKTHGNDYDPTQHA